MPRGLAVPEYRTIVVPLDGSPLSESVLQVAGSLAKATDARVDLVRVHEPPRMAMTSAYEWNRETAQRELDYLAAVAGRFERSTGLRAETCLLTGHVADAIRRTSQRDEKTLILMSSHGRTGFSRFWLGSVADAVVRGSKSPVLMVRGEAAAHEGLAAIHRVLVPLDGSTLAESILPHAAWLAGATGASLELIRVIPPSDIPQVTPAVQEDAAAAAIRAAEASLRAVAERLCSSVKGPVGVTVRVHDSPAAAINAYALANGIEVVALTSRGAGLARLIGSVADKLVRDGPPMVLLFRPPERSAPAFTSQ